MIIEVTQEDIRFGQRHSPEECPVARACSRVFVGQRVRVSSSHANVGLVAYKLPPEAADFIDRFDGCLSVQPLEFEL